jgi:catechol 2,3-dioxygenase-like lactoylglutathione lyase family enzyme
MNEPSGILSLVTLGVTDLKRSIAFYETLGFRRKALAADGVGFSRLEPVPSPSFRPTNLRMTQT